MLYSLYFSSLWTLLSIIIIIIIIFFHGYTTELDYTYWKVGKSLIWERHMSMQEHALNTTFDLGVFHYSSAQVLKLG